MNFKVVIQKDEDGRYNASCPELKGCNSYGNSPEDALKNIREAIELYLEDIPRDQIPEIKCQVEFTEVAI
ncbi:type II toxin-antitoxin system HicB family antitoxin [bacterium]|jgi:predicted RNase H-like HicB family nuclease|nr:type II toxin-antitoxin system HicB family antitoxin [bacterium]